MRRRSSQLSIALVALILGALLAVQLQSQNPGGGLEGLSAQELTDVVGNLNTRNEQLRTERAQLQAEVQQLTEAEARGENSVGQLQSDLLRIQAWSGALAVSGPGVRLTVTGPIPGPAVEDLLNELRNAGAEALAVSGQRVVAGTVVAGPVGGVSVEGVPLGATFEIAAIGNPPSLTGSLTRSGGMMAQLRATLPEVELVVTPADRLVLPATTRTLTPAHAAPRL
jgi:uncharacterized protein YlxW (UPF0749 family)